MFFDWFSFILILTNQKSFIIFHLIEIVFPYRLYFLTPFHCIHSLYCLFIDSFHLVRYTKATTIITLYPFYYRHQVLYYTLFSIIFLPIELLIHIILYLLSSIPFKRLFIFLCERMLNCL